MVSDVSFWLGILASFLSVFSIFLAIFLYYFSTARNNLISEIKEILGKCRECSSWNERSECKLFQYIGAEENRLGRYTLKSLVEIRNRIYEYLKVHLEMEGKEEDYPYKVPFCTWKEFLRYELFGSKPDTFVP